MSAAFALYDLQASEQLHLASSKISQLSKTSPMYLNKKPAPKPELAFYRKYSEAMLRRYTRLSMTVGRMPARWVTMRFEEK